MLFLEVDQLRNAPAMQITDITLPDTLTVINHGLRNGNYIAIESMSGSTLENLRAAADGEEHEWTEMYPAFAKTAREEGFTAVAVAFEAISIAALISQMEQLYS